MNIINSKNTFKEMKPSINTLRKESIPKIERSLSENTLENPQPTIFKLMDIDLQAHKRYFRSFAINKEVLQPILPEFLNKEGKNSFNDDYEYILKDNKGETKITENGFLLNGRKFLFTTFTLPGRGKRLYALATEVAKVLGYRDAFVFFMKNKNLYKNTTSDKERIFLEQSGFHVSKVKTRPISVVNVRSIFIHYGARVICQGKRVIDDYWEEEIIKQNFKPEDQVFPVDRKYYPKNLDRSKLIQVNTKQKLRMQERLLVSQLPSLEDRQTYLISSSNGSISQILPGQGITGGFELASMATLPKYRTETSSTSRHKSILSTLVTDTKSQPIPVTQTTNQVPIDDKLAGNKSAKGLPYYEKGITKRIANENSNKLHEVEYLHGTVETNNLITFARKQRNRQWGYYWQVKSGTRLGLTREDADEFLQEQQDSLNEVQQEIIFNEQIQREQIVTKRKRPNPNFPGRGNINGLKPPYIDRPKDDTLKQTSIPEVQFHGQQIPSKYPPQHIQQSQQIPYQGLR